MPQLRMTPLKFRQGLCGEETKNSMLLSIVDWLMIVQSDGQMKRGDGIAIALCIDVLCWCAIKIQHAGVFKIHNIKCKSHETFTVQLQNTPWIMKVLNMLRQHVLWWTILKLEALGQCTPPPRPSYQCRDPDRNGSLPGFVIRIASKI